MKFVLTLSTNLCAVRPEHAFHRSTSDTTSDTLHSGWSNHSEDNQNGTEKVGVVPTLSCPGAVVRMRRQGEGVAVRPRPLLWTLQSHGRSGSACTCGSQHSEGPPQTQGHAVQQLHLPECGRDTDV